MRRRAARPDSIAATAALALALTSAACRPREALLPLPDDAGVHASVAAPEAAPRGPEVVGLERVVVRREEPGAGHELYDDELAKTFGRELSASPGFLAPGTSSPPPGRRLRRAHGELVVAGDIRQADGGILLLVAVDATLHWLDGEGGAPPTDRAVAERRLPRGASAEGKLALLAADVVLEAARGVAARQALRAGDDAAILAELAVADPARLRWALQLAGERRLAAAREPASKLVASAAAGVADAAIDTLVVLGDPRAVPALIAKVDFKDHVRLRQVVEAVVALGGAEATEFLDFVASGHPDPDIKRLAADGLARVRRRAPGRVPDRGGER
jgi:hypothetical protein